MATTSQTIAWLSTLFCTLFSARIAKTFLRQSTRLFTVMALFALVWALLLPYYSDAINSELLPAYGGFLLVYIGGLLALEAKSRAAGAGHVGVSYLQGIGLWLFLFIAAPSILSISGPNGKPVFQVDSRKVELFVGTLLNVLGYVSCVYGCYCLFDRHFFYLIGLTFTLYSLLEIAFTSWAFAHQNAPMPPLFRIAFAASKFIVTILFGYRVAVEAMSPTEKLRPIQTFIVKQLPFN